MKLPDANSQETTTGIHKETINWKWPYELKEGTATEKAAYDKKDTIDSGKTVSMEITVTGTQTLEEPPLTLAEQIEKGKVKIGDYVDYNASSNGEYAVTKSEDLDGIEGVTLRNSGNTADVEQISTADGFYNVSNEATSKWRILNVKEGTGEIELIAAEPTTVRVKLSGTEGFKNAEDVLKKIGEIYGHGKGATGGRSIKIEDIEKYSQYPYTQYVNSESSTGTYGGTKKYTSGTKFYKEKREYDENGKCIDPEDEQGKYNVEGYADTITGAPETMTQTYYTYTASSYFKTEKEKQAYNAIFLKSVKNPSTTSNKESFWLASRCVYLHSDDCRFYVRYVGSGYVDGSNVFRSSGYTNSATYRVLPVVTLKSDIQITGDYSERSMEIKGRLNYRRRRSRHKTKDKLHTYHVKNGNTVLYCHFSNITLAKKAYIY